MGYITTFCTGTFLKFALADSQEIYLEQVLCFECSNNKSIQFSSSKSVALFRRFRWADWRAGLQRWLWPRSGSGPWKAPAEEAGPETWRGPGLHLSQSGCSCGVNWQHPGTSYHSGRGGEQQSLMGNDMTFSRRLVSDVVRSTFFSAFSSFVLCVNVVSDAVQSFVILTPFPHHAANSAPPTYSAVFLVLSLVLCGFNAVIMRSLCRLSVLLMWDDVDVFRYCGCFTPTILNPACVFEWQDEERSRPLWSRATCILILDSYALALSFF